MSSQTPSPKFVHDCDKCDFMGVRGQYDTYFHVYETGIATVLLRFGSEGEEYLSFPTSVLVGNFDPEDEDKKIAFQVLAEAANGRMRRRVLRAIQEK